MAVRRSLRNLTALVATVALAGLLATGTSACTSPTLPLPPPASPSIGAGLEPDTYLLTSIQGAEPQALVVIVNRREDLPPYERVNGTIADAQGTWTAYVKAKPGDVLDVSQESGTTRSPPTAVTIPTR